MSIQAEAPAPSLQYNSAIMHAGRRRAFFFLCMAVAAASVAMSVQGSINANFVADEMHLTGLQQGALESVRETCGITALLVLVLLAGLCEPLVASLMLALLAVGVSAYAHVPNYLWLVLMSLVWSQGLHVWTPLPNSMALALAEPGRAGRRLGQLQSAGAVGAGLGLLVALGLTWVKVPIRPMYYVAGVAAMLAALSCLCIPRNIKTPGPRFVFRKRYGLYYALQFLDGWRKQIFIAFAGYNLVHEHGASLTTMLVLAMVTTGINWFSGPIIGWIVDHVGERRTLVAYFAALVPVCLGYALIGDARVLYVIFVLDNVLFPLGGMAQTTYVNRIAPPSEHTATLSMGVASNHVASVIMPLVGGLLWTTLGSQWVFLVGAVTAAASITAAMAVPRRSHPVAAVA